MKKNKEKKELKDIRHYWGVLIIAMSLILTFSVYVACEYRLIDAAVDFLTSMGYYFCFLVGFDGLIVPTVSVFPEMDLNRYLPITVEEIQRKLEAFPDNFFDLNNFFGYLIFVLEKANFLIIILSLLVPGVSGMLYLILDRYKQEHIKDKEEPKGKLRRLLWRFSNWRKKIALRICDFFELKISQLRSYLKTYADYYIKHDAFIKWFVFIWLVNTNVVTILIETVAYYFYFVISFDIVSFGVLLCKLCYDIIIMLWTLPLPLWCGIFYIVFDYWRKEHAIKELKHMEKKNRGYDNQLPPVVMCTGTVGKGKTKTVVDISLSREHEFRDKALELMDKNMLRFPNFDFQAFEATLKEQIAARNIINLASTRQYIMELRYHYGRHPSPDNFWGYNVAKYSRSYNNGVELVGIWTVLMNYAQEYFIYTMSTSLIISNFAIRSDLDPIDEGYFNTWNQDFFKRDPAKMDEYSVYSHIIDFDLYRIGCQMNKENSISGSFEFGVIVVTEIGKERGNNLENQGKDKKSLEANQKNDKFNEWLKMIRHAATVEGYCFVIFICDEQRASSWGADARDLCAVLNIEECSSLYSTLIYSWIPDIFMNIIIPKYFKWYNEVKVHGNENRRLVKYLHRAVGWYFGRCERKMLTYGYYVEILGQESGTLEDKEVKLHEYYIMPKKIYARRYATDCFKEGFANKALASGTSLYYLDTYKTYCAMLEELGKQHSYFANLFLDMYATTCD